MPINVIFKNWLENSPHIPLFATHKEQVEILHARIKWKSFSHCTIHWENEAEKEFLTEIAEQFIEICLLQHQNYQYILKA